MYLYFVLWMLSILKTPHDFKRTKKRENHFLVAATKRNCFNEKRMRRGDVKIGKFFKDNLLSDKSPLIFNFCHSLVDENCSSLSPRIKEYYWKNVEELSFEYLIFIRLLSFAGWRTLHFILMIFFLEPHKRLANFIVAYRLDYNLIYLLGIIIHANQFFSHSNDFSFSVNLRN